MALTRPKYSQIYDTDWKQSVEAGTIGSDIGNLIVGNTQPSILDGFSLSIGNRILVKDQTDGTQNGIYQVANVGTGSNGWWYRTHDANQSGFVTSGLTVVVDAGTVNGGREFRLITQDPITLGSTSLTFISQTGNPGGANTQVQFYDSISGIPQLSGTPGFTYNKTSNAVVMSGNLSVSNINATANISTAQLNAGQINTTGNILSTGAILNALTVNGGITSTGFFNTTANISTAQLNAGQIHTTGNVLATNAVINALTVNGVTTQSGNLNVTNGNLNVVGTTWVTGNILPTANVTYNLGSPTNKFKSAYFSGNTVYIGSESMGVDTNGTWLFTSNGATVSLGINATFNPASVNASGNIIAGAIYSGIIGNVNTALTGTLQTAAQPNITSVGTLTSLNVTGNVLASSLTGTLTTASQTAITQIGTLAGLNVSGNVTTNVLNAPLVYANTYVSAGAVYAPTIGNTGAVLTGTLSTAAQTNITSVGSLNTLNVLGNTTIGGNLTVTGTITTLGNVNNITITGNSGQFFGNTNGFGALYAGIGVGYTLEPQTILQLSANYNGYAQLNLQNTNSGPAASGDLVVTMDTGNTSQGYIDMGINSSGFVGGAGNELNYPGDGYLYVQGNVGGLGGNLLLSTDTPADIVFAVNGQGSANEIGRFVNANKSFKVTGNINATGNIISAVNNTGFLNSSGNVSGVIGNFGSVNATGNVSAATVIAGQINTTGNVLGLVGSFGSINSTGLINTTGNVSAATIIAGQINTTGNVLAVNFVGSGGLLTALPGYAYSNVNVTAYTQTMGYTNYSNVNVAAYLAGSISTGAITASGAINTTANISAATVVAGQINTTGNILSNGAVLNTLTVNSNVSTNVASVASTVVVGAIGVTGNIIANASVVYGNPTGMNGVRQFYNPVTNSLDTVFG